MAMEREALVRRMLRSPIRGAAARQHRLGAWWNAEISVRTSTVAMPTTGCDEAIPSKVRTSMEVASSLRF